MRPSRFLPVLLFALRAVGGAAQELPTGGPSWLTPIDVIKAPKSLAGTNVTWVVRFKALFSEFAPGQPGAGDRVVYEWRDNTGTWTDRVIVGPPIKQTQMSDAGSGQPDRLDADPRVIAGSVRGIETVIDASGQSQIAVVLEGVTLGRLPGSGKGAGLPDANGVYEPGHGVTWPEVAREVRPRYPSGARDRRIECVVDLELIVREDGRVAEARITKISIDKDSYGFAEAALAAAKQWRFKPGLKDGKPVPTRVGLVLEFRLHEP